MMKPLLLCVFLAANTAGFTMNCEAAWSAWLSEPTRVYPATGGGTFGGIDLSVDGPGSETMLTWASYYGSPGSGITTLQRLDGAGNPVDQTVSILPVLGIPGVIGPQPGDEIRPRIAYHPPTNQYLVTVSTKAASFTRSMSAYFVSASGELLTDASVIGAGDTDATLIYNPIDDTFFSAARELDANGGIQGTLLSASGAVQATSQITPASIPFGPLPDAPFGGAALNTLTNEYFVAWREQDPCCTLKGRFLDSNGGPTGAQFVVGEPSTDLAAYQLFSPIRVDFSPTTGGYLLAYGAGDHFGYHVLGPDGGSLRAVDDLFSGLTAEDDWTYFSDLEIAYSTEHSMFLVAASINGERLVGQFVNPAGELVGNSFDVADIADGRRINEFALIYNRDADRFVVSWIDSNARTFYDNVVYTRTITIPEPSAILAAMLGLGFYATRRSG